MERKQTAANRCWGSEPKFKPIRSPAPASPHFVNEPIKIGSERRIDDKAVHLIRDDFLRGAFRTADHGEPAPPGFEIDDPKSFLG